MNKILNRNAGRAMSNIPQVRNDLHNPIRNFQVLLGDRDAINLKGNKIEIDIKKLQASESFDRKDLLLAFHHLNESGAEFPCSVLIHVSKQESKTHLSNGHEYIIADHEIVQFDLISHKFS